MNEKWGTKLGLLWVIDVCYTAMLLITDKNV